MFALWFPILFIIGYQGTGIDVLYAILWTLGCGLVSHAYYSITRFLKNDKEVDTFLINVFDVLTASTLQRLDEVERRIKNDH